MKRILMHINLILVILLISTITYGQSKQDIQQLHNHSLQDNKIAKGAEPVNLVTQSDFDYTKLVTSDRTRDILYDNGPFITNPGIGTGGTDYSEIQDLSLGMMTFGFGMQIGSNNSLGEDFVVTGNWIISTITFYGYQTNAGPPSTIDEIRFQVYDDNPRGSGEVIFGDLYANKLISTTWVDAWRLLESDHTENRPIMEIVADASGLELPPGTYWIEWQAEGTESSGPWANLITIPGETTTGNALQNNAGVWSALVDNGTNTPQGFPFLINGTLGTQYDNDLAISKIISPASGISLGEEDIKVRISNYGTNDQNDFDVSYSVNGGAIVTETISETVPANEAIIYTFTVKADLSEFGEHIIEVCTSLTGDEDPDNDCKTKSVINNQGAYVYPIMDDYWTGSTDSVDKTQTSLANCIGGSTPEIGWMKFDISSIPAEEVIKSVTFVGYVNDALFPFWSITPLLSDPLTTSAADLHTEIQNGVGLLAYSLNDEDPAFTTGWHEYQLGNGAIEDFTAAVEQGWFAVGIGSRDSDPLFRVNFDGWNEINMPYLIINYGVNTTLCQPIYTGGCEYGDGFDNFVFEQIQNYGTGCENNAGLGWSQYLDLYPAILSTGNTYTASFNTHYLNHNATFWIDFNDNYYFDVNEKVVSNFPMLDTLVMLNVDITIPPDAEPGLHPMRARTRFYYGCNYPCDIYNYGEAEDYYVLVTNNHTEDCNHFDDLTTGGYVAEQLGGYWTTVSGTSSDDALVVDDNSLTPDNSFVVDENTTDLLLQYGTGPLSSGQWLYSHYMYVPTSKSGSFNIQTDPNAGADINLGLNFYDGGTGTFSGQSTDAFEYEQDTWFLLEISYDLDADLARVMINSETILEFTNTETIGGINYYGSEEGGDPGTYFDDVCFGEGWVTTDIEGKTDQNVQTYPNPVNGILNIESAVVMESVTIYNQTGQVIEVQEINSEQLQLDLSQYKPGIYSLRILSQNGIISKRVVVQ